MKNLKSLFWRNFLVYSCMLLGVFIIFGSSFIILVDKYSSAEKQATLNRTAKRAAELTSVVVNNSHYMTEQLYVLGISLLASDSGSNIIVCNTQGESVYFVMSDGTFVNQTVSVPSEVLVGIMNSGDYSSVSTLNGIFSSAMFIVGTPVFPKNSSIPAGAVFVALSTEHTTNLLLMILKIFVYGIIISLLVSLSVSYVLTAYLVHPLRTMANAAKSFSQGDFSVRVPVSPKRNDEISALAISFNNMATSLEHTEEQRRGFVANVSHDLKTPMTTIQGFVDGIIDGTIPPDKQTEYLERVSAETKRLSRLAVRMLDMSKIECGGIVLNKSVFDICEMTSQIILNFEQILTSKNVDVSLDLPDSMQITADRDTLFQVVYNLVDNAVKFVPENGTLHIKISQSQRILNFSISNSGDCIPSEDLPYIFDRFYKADHSRGLNKKGSGLGLYIAKSIINLHGGTITAESADNLTSFSFKIPTDGHTEII